MSTKTKLPRLSRESVAELNKLFRTVPPDKVAAMLTKLYMTYFADDESDLSEEFQRFYRPLYLLIITLKKMDMGESS
jgi:hypothetical protein